MTAPLDTAPILELRSLELRVASGEHVGIIGDTQPGRIALLQGVAGLRTIAPGELLVSGTPIERFDYLALRAHRLRTGYALGGDALLANQTIYENAALPLRYHTRLRRRELGGRVEALLAELGLATWAGALPDRCPPATACLALVARALALEPALLLLEEPRAELDPPALGRLAAAVERRRAERGLTVIQTGHPGPIEHLVPDRVFHLPAGSPTPSDR